MKLNNSNLFETLSQIRSGSYSDKYAAMAKTQSSAISSAAGKTAEKPTDNSGSSQSKILTFDNMTRTQLSDWLTKGLDSGKIPAEQGLAFRVLLYSGKAESSGEQAKEDTTVVDFTEKAKDALRSAVQRRDKSSILLWANAMATIKKFQGQEA